MLKIYHNPRCSKSRAGLAYLNDNDIPREVVEYLKTPLSVDEMKKLFMKLNLKPADVVRTQEDIYKKELKGKNFTDEEWIRIILENPKLLKRPIVEGQTRAVIAIPPEKIDELKG
jgi:arsenate reductase (glutaredoxin)